MSSALELFQQKRDLLKEKWETVTPRDKILLVGLIAFILVACIGFKFFLMIREVDALAAESEKYRKSLNYIAENQVTYQKNKAELDVARSQLIAADAKISSKLNSMGSALGIDVNVSPKDARKIDEESGVEETEIELQIKNVDYTKLLEYLIQIHKLDTPIYMRHINMSRTSNINSSETKMTASITLISYRIKESNDS